MFARLSFCLSLGLLALLVSPRPALAHHGWGGNSTEESEITGTVEKGLSLSGPHATMQIRAQGQLWDITLAPPAATQRAGLTENMIPVGTTVTVHGNRNLDPKRFEMKCERVTWNGRTFDVYPDRK